MSIVWNAALRRGLCLVALLTACASARADVLTPSDFAEGLTVVPVGDAPVQRIELPLAIYAGAVRSDLGDLRVFDPSGAQMPYSIVERSDPPAAISGFEPLPIFPLPAAALSGAALNVRVDTSGAVVSVQGGEQARGAAVKAYLIDVSKHAGNAQPQPPLRELQLILGGTADVVGTVQIERGDASLQFSPLVTAAPVTRLLHAGRSLEQLRVELPDHEARYLRLTLTSQGGELTLSGVQGRRAAEVLPAPRTTAFVSGVVDGDGLVFDLRARLPVVGVAVDLVDDNSFLEARLLCADADVAPVSKTVRSWRALGVTRLYRLSSGTVVRRSEALRFATATCRYVRLEAMQKALPLPASARLQALWTPAELWFLRRGNAAHVVAFGSNQVAPAPAPLANLMREMQEAGADAAVPTAQVGRVHALGGAQRRTAAAPTDWRKLLLWGVLLVGVLLVVGLAVRVLREQPSP